MKNLIATVGAVMVLLIASSCGDGSSGTDTVDSLETSPIDSSLPKDTVYPKTDTTSYRKDSAQPKQ